MIMLPPNTYCEITNPIQRDKEGFPVKDKH